MSLPLKSPSLFKSPEAGSCKTTAQLLPLSEKRWRRGPGKAACGISHASLRLRESRQEGRGGTLDKSLDPPNARVLLLTSLSCRVLYSDEKL